MGRNRGGAYLSDKQSYVIAKAALEKGLVKKDSIFAPMTKEEKAKEEWRKERKRDANRRRDRKKLEKQGIDVAKPYKRSSTKVEIGAKVTTRKGEATITRIITKSTGYVEVQYSSGAKGKEMAFNLYGTDGNPLRKKPKN